MTKTVKHDSEARIWEEAGVMHIDVRGLVPPQPMLEIIKLLDTEVLRDRIVMHHDREPVYLFPELAERHWDYAIEHKGEEFIIQLTRKPKPS